MKLPGETITVAQRMKAQTQQRAQNPKDKATKIFQAKNIVGKGMKRLLLKDGECINS